MYVCYRHISFTSQLACNITPAALLGDIAVVSLVLRLEWEWDCGMSYSRFPYTGTGWWSWSICCQAMAAADLWDRGQTSWDCKELLVHFTSSLLQCGLCCWRFLLSFSIHHLFPMIVSHILNMKNEILYHTRNTSYNKKGINAFLVLG